MFSVEIVGFDKVEQRLDTMINDQLNTMKTTAVPEELQAWQTEDMRRRFPNQTVETAANETKATTQIWPRSRIDDGHGKKAGPNRVGPKTYRLNRGGGRPPPSNRPILRPQLKQQLGDRMAKLMQGITWQST